MGKALFIPDTKIRQMVEYVNVKFWKSQINGRTGDIKSYARE